MKLENYKIENGLYKCECGREFKSSVSLNSHFRFCKIHIPIDKTILKSIYKISEIYINVNVEKNLIIINL